MYFLLGIYKQFHLRNKQLEIKITLSQCRCDRCSKQAVVVAEEVHSRQNPPNEAWMRFPRQAGRDADGTSVETGNVEFLRFTFHHSKSKGSGQASQSQGKRLIGRRPPSVTPRPQEPHFPGQQDRPQLRPHLILTTLSSRCQLPVLPLLLLLRGSTPPGKKATSEKASGKPG